jgi:hypothetical protein
MKSGKTMLRKAANSVAAADLLSNRGGGLPTEIENVAARMDHSD